MHPASTFSGHTRKCICFEGRVDILLSWIFRVAFVPLPYFLVSRHTLDILQYNTLDNFKNFHSFLMSSDLKATSQKMHRLCICCCCYQPDYSKVFRGAITILHQPFSKSFPGTDPLKCKRALTKSDIIDWPPIEMVKLSQ